MAEITVGEKFDYSDPTTYIPTIFEVGGKAVTGKPSDQIVASLAIAAGAIATSYLSAGATLVLVVPALFFAFVGFVRLAWCVVK